MEMGRRTEDGGLGSRGAEEDRIKDVDEDRVDGKDDGG